MNNRYASCRSGSSQMPCGAVCNTKNDTACACPKSRMPAVTPYAMAYVPFQQSTEVYACDKALSRGTVFPCLDLPFLKGCCR